MKVLIVNDDGIESEGLRVLAERVGKEHEVYVIAPDSNRSATSHHVVMFQDLELKKFKRNQWSCSGMPADCTSVGLTSDFFDFDFDVVLSGINCGANMGTDVIFSGTCAGARQAVLNKVPGIALSIDPIDWEKAHKEGFKYVALADFVTNNLESLISLCTEKYPGTFVNINAASLNAYKGVKLNKKLCIRDYPDKLTIIKSETGIFSHFNSQIDNPTPVEKETDLDAVQKGYISISCIYVEPVAADIVDCISFKV
ncbi:MAG: 5'/3'-nucleotidase SurE [Treponema sp.]|nr:5'/3'-nucleotidase SurE [Treponema sp.]